MKTTFMAAGDSFTTRRIPDGYPGREELAEFINRHDVRFNNLEMTYHCEEGYPAAFSGGTWAMADPVILDDIQRMGFNLYNTANNHSGDYGHGGILATIRNLREREMLFTGTGKDMEEASKAVYLETAQCRVALIAVTADFYDSDIAGMQGPVMAGRPGVNGLRVETTYCVRKEYFHTLEKIVNESKMNSMAEFGAQIGYMAPSDKGHLSMNGMNFAIAEECRVQTRPKEADLKRIAAEIQEAKRQADYVMVSIHAHDGRYTNYMEPAEFMEVFAHACIDGGADAILGHGPHALRAIEIYKEKPIFYSLGNFIFQTETVAKQPAEAYLDKGFPMTAKVGEYMDARSSHGKRGYGVLPPVWFSVIPSWTVEDGSVKEIRLYPITLGMELPRSRKGLPRLVKDERILEYFQKLCNLYGTKIEREDGVGIIRI